MKIIEKIKNNIEEKKSTSSNDSGVTSGFTLIETLVAIFILVLSVTGPMTAAQNSLKASFLARDQIVAFYLAQDAIEYIKNQKDANMIVGATVIEESVKNRCKNGPCNIDTTKGDSLDVAISLCPQGVCNPLWYDSNTKQYVTNSGGSRTTSKFTREVYLKEGGINGEYVITVVIRWKSNFLGDRQIVVQENIYNWLVI